MEARDLLAVLRRRDGSDLWCARCGSLATRVGPTTHRAALPWAAYCAGCPPHASYALDGGRPALAALLGGAGPLDPTTAAAVLLGDAGLGLHPCRDCGGLGARWRPPANSPVGQDWYCAAHDPGGTRETSQGELAELLAAARPGGDR